MLQSDGCRWCSKSGRSPGHAAPDGLPICASIEFKIRPATHRPTGPARPGTGAAGRPGAGVADAVSRDLGRPQAGDRPVQRAGDAAPTWTWQQTVVLLRSLREVLAAGRFRLQPVAISSQVINENPPIHCRPRRPGGGPLRSGRSSPTLTRHERRPAFVQQRRCRHRQVRLRHRRSWSAWITDRVLRRVRPSLDSGPRPADVPIDFVQRNRPYQWLRRRPRQEPVRVAVLQAGRRSCIPKSCRCRVPAGSRFSSTRPESGGRAPTVRLRWRAVACAGRTAGRISAPRSWAWSRRRPSRTR